MATTATTTGRTARFATTAARRPLTATQRLREQIASAQRQLRGYLAMLEIATEHGMEYEQERIRASIDEWMTEVNELNARMAMR